MKYTEKEGGRWKTASNEITEVLPNGERRIRFVPVEPHATPEAMHQLHEGLRWSMRESGMDPLLLIPLYVLDFLCVHPFLDGNGRMTRLLTVLLLYHQGYEVGRYISLERIVEQTKESYYDTLYASSQGWHEAKHDPIPWIEYLLSTFLAAYREFEGRVGQVKSGYGSKTEMVLSAISGFVGDFSISDVEETCPAVGRDWIRTILQRLKREGQIEPVGRGRYARWRKVQ